MKRLFLFILVIAIAIAAGALALVIARVNQPYKGFEASEQFVDIPTGSGVASIGRRLADAGVIRDPVSFRYAVWLIGGSRSLKAGEYRFDRAMTPEEVARKLARGDVYLRQITFREGLTIRDMAALFEKDGFGPRQAFVDAASRPELIRGLDPRPGAWTELNGAEIKLFSPRVTAPPFPGTGAPGAILSAEGSIVVACGPFKDAGGGVVEIFEVQPAGKARMPADDWLRGARVSPGAKFA